MNRREVLKRRKKKKPNYAIWRGVTMYNPKGKNRETHRIYTQEGSDVIESNNPEK